MTLRLRLLIALVPLFVIGLVAAEAGTYAALRSFLVSRVDGQILASERDVEGYLERGDLGGDRGPGPRGGPGSVPQYTYGELLSPDGQVLHQHTFASVFGADDPATRPVLPSDLGVSATSQTLASVPGTGAVSRYRLAINPAVDGTGNVLVVGFPLDDVDSTLSQLLLLELGISAAVTLVLVGATWMLVRQSLRPLERMGATARSIVASDLSRRVGPATEKTEVGRLGLALNAMLGQLETAFAERQAGEERLRHFVSDASHELRTPLTSMRGYAELFRRNPDMDRAEIGTAMRRIEDEAKRMGVLVDDLLLLARLDQGRPLERLPVDLEALVTDACADARVADPARPVTTRIAAPLVVTGDAERLRQVLGNLLRNAVVHTPARTPVEVVLRADGVEAVIEVVDHGPGIAPQERERIFERFHRSRPGRSRDRGGSGLGLSIVAAVIAAHQGRVEIDSTPGGGATFRVVLPLAAAPPSPEDGAAPAGADRTGAGEDGGVDLPGSDPIPSLL